MILTQEFQVDRAITRITQGWCQKAMALDVNGKKVDTVYNPSACKWCLVGSLLLNPSEFSVLGGHVYYKAILLLRELHQAELSYWNDTQGRTQSEVLAFLEALRSI